LYVARIPWEPTARLFVLTEACPAALSAVVPNEVAVVVSMNVTVPVGVGPEPFTTAVKVTDSPNTVVLSDENNAVVDGSAEAAGIGRNANASSQRDAHQQLPHFPTPLARGYASGPDRDGDCDVMPPGQSFRPSSSFLTG
jgi:hypothetical protein